MSKLFLLILTAVALFAQERPIVLRASTVFDGKGATLHNTIIVIEGSKIARVGGAAPADAIVYDLSSVHGLARLDRYAFAPRLSLR